MVEFSCISRSTAARMPLTKPGASAPQKVLAVSTASEIAPSGGIGRTPGATSGETTTHTYYTSATIQLTGRVQTGDVWSVTIGGLDYKYTVASTDTASQLRAYIADAVIRPTFAPTCNCSASWRYPALT